MPYTLKPNKLFVKNPNGEGYLPQNVVTDSSTADQIAAIEGKGAETLASIPDDYTELSGEVGDLKSTLTYDESLFNNGIYVIKADMLESGQWSYSRKTVNSTRARTKNLLPVWAGMKITYANTTFDTFFGVLETPTSPTYIQVGGWKTDGNGTISITKDGWLTFVIRNHTNTAADVNPADYDSTVTINIDKGFMLQASHATKINATEENPVNLNDYTTPGNYIVMWATVARYIINGPTQLVGYRLLVLENINDSYITQIAFLNSGGNYERMAIRNLSASGWTPWQSIASKDYVDSALDKTILPKNIVLTSSNYTDYFPNGSFNDAAPNTIYGISANVPLSDGPEGDGTIGAWISSSDQRPRTRGYIRGTLITLTQSTNHTIVQSGLLQILIGYRANTYKPTLSYRIAINDNNSYTWSAWSKFEENGYLHASNTVIFGGVDVDGNPYTDATITDLNDMPNNCIMQIDLNMDGSDSTHTLAHHPAPGISCVAMCYAYSYSSDHGKVQTVYTLSGQLFWRYGYQQAPNDYRWTAWRRCVVDDGSYLQNKGRLANGSDLNNIQENAIYLLGGQDSAAYVNSPITAGAAFLTVKHTNDVTLQVIESLGGSRYSRYSADGNTWSNWTT